MIVEKGNFNSKELNKLMKMRIILLTKILMKKNKFYVNFKNKQPKNLNLRTTKCKKEVNKKKILVQRKHKKNK